VTRLTGTKTAPNIADAKHVSGLGNPRRWMRSGGYVSWRSAALPVLALALFVALAFAAAYGAVPISPLTSAAILLN
jgi:hypothetical protein